MLFHLLRLQQTSIYQQLQLEEALLRADDRNWCVVNEGSDEAIVMGISGKKEELVDPLRWRQHPVPIIQRFSGGGTVVVDRSTCFVTLIGCVKESNLPPFPQKVAEWNARYYVPFLKEHGFRLLENDYVLGKHKFGGNAQYLTKERWLHHSTLLWDYNPRLMALLTLPKKIPTYREARPHDQFLCKLKEVVPSAREVIDQYLASLKQDHQVVEVGREEVEEILARPHRRSTKLLQSAPQKNSLKG